MVVNELEFACPDDLREGCMKGVWYGASDGVGRGGEETVNVESKYSPSMMRWSEVSPARMVVTSPERVESNTQHTKTRANPLYRA